MTWQIGDLAVCVIKVNDTPIQLGDVHLVREVLTDWDGSKGLLFADAPDPIGYDCWEALAFRKVVRDEHEACEPEFVTLLNRVKRRQSA